MNAFQPLYDACNTGTNAAKLAVLSDFPSLIDIEPSGLCNQRCLMCPTGLGALGRPQNFMSLETFGKIVDECGRHGTAIRFIGWGEPTLNPNIVDFIVNAFDLGLLTHLNTNGTKIDSYMASGLIDAGLSSLKFSFQGIDRESYLAMRRMDYFEGLLEAIRITHEARGRRKEPFLAVSTSVTNETPEQIAAFRELVSPYVDHVGIGRTVFDFIERDKVPAKQLAKLDAIAGQATDAKRHPSPCPEVWEKVSIHWDGSAVVWCNAYGTEGIIGNVNQTPISDLWRHGVMEAYRERLARDEYSGPLCSVCYDYAGLTEGAAA